MPNMKKRLIHISVGYNELTASPIRVSDTNELERFLRREIGELHDRNGNILSDDDVIYALDTCGIGSLYDMPSGTYAANGKSVLVRTE